jgi:hypothetical protein
MRLDLILFGVLAALCIFYITVWKVVIAVTVLTIAYFAVEWLLDFDWRGK